MTLTKQLLGLGMPRRHIHHTPDTSTRRLRTGCTACCSCIPPPLPTPIPSPLPTTVRLPTILPSPLFTWPPPLLLCLLISSSLLSILLTSLPIPWILLLPGTCILSCVLFLLSRLLWIWLPHTACTLRILCSIIV